MTVPLDAECRIEPNPGLRSIDGGRILIGGAPFRILRLRAGGAELIRSWFAGGPIDDRPAHHDLARRLERNGMATIRWPAPKPEGAQEAGVRSAVIIPSHDDQDELDRTMACAVDRWADEVIVVDDGSERPITAPSPRVTLRRHDRPVGPGMARQRGLDATEADVVVFLDAGVTITPEDASGLLAAFVDPAVVAAAPRVRSEPAGHLVGRYDLHRSPLDLGPAESLVGPGRQVPYVPTACLAVRSAAVREVGGFDPGLRYGEDVDLVWRLEAIGIVRYLPHLSAVHRPRATLAAMVAQRHHYGSSAAALAQRHGADALTPCRVSPWTALVVGLALATRPFLAAGTIVGTGLALGPKLEPMPDARIEALALTARGHWYGGLSVLTATTRAWAPLLLPLLLGGGRSRRTAGTILAAAAGRRLLDGPRQGDAAAIDVAIGLVDDLAYCSGLWRGAIEQRSAGPLRPVLASWPGGGPSLRQRLSARWSRLTGRGNRSGTGAEPRTATRR